MFAITGITGRVGGAVARHLIEDGHKVRAVVRSEHKARSWAALGCDVAVASIDVGAALARAFTGTQGVFLMSPPNYDPAPGFPDTVHAATQIRHAIESGAPGRVVFLSTIGAHVNEPNLLNNALIMEQMLRSTSVPVALLRAAWFMENAAGDVDSAARGVIHSFLQPLDHAIPMVATADIARAVAELLTQAWTALRIIELEGPRRYSALDVAAGFAAVLGRPVQAEAVPRNEWESLFRAQGMKNPVPRMRMIDGFNEGWIDFEFGAASLTKGSVPLESVLRTLVGQAQTRTP